MPWVGTSPSPPGRRAAGRDAEVRWYRDRFTGQTMDRPGFQKLMKAIREGKVSAIVVWRLDRLGRTTRGLTERYLNLTDRAWRAIRPRL